MASAIDDAARGASFVGHAGAGGGEFTSVAIRDASTGSEGSLEPGVDISVADDARAGARWAAELEKQIPGADAAARVAAFRAMSRTEREEVCRVTARYAFGVKSTDWQPYHAVFGHGVQLYCVETVEHQRRKDSAAEAKAAAKSGPGRRAVSDPSSLFDGSRSFTHTTFVIKIDGKGRYVSTTADSHESTSSVVPEPPCVIQ